MRLLLDTHALLWSVLDDPHLSSVARAAVGDPNSRIVVSAVSIFEISLKHRLGKLPRARPFALHYERMMADLEWEPLPVAIKHAGVAGSLDISHKDPFDRLLIAQAIAEDLALVSNERLFDGFGVRRIW